MTTYDTMVHYMATRSAVQEAGQPQSPDLTAELAAMQKIATALNELRDAQARLRVLRWAEGFSGVPDAAASVSVPTGQPALLALFPPPPSYGPDTTLTLDGYDLFGDGPSDDPPPQRAPGMSPQGTPGMAAQGTSGMAPLRTPGMAEETLDSMVKGLVADFHQIARDWNGE
jgi:hypothetical protein